MIKRNIEEEIRDCIGTGKAIIIYGPRQVGKTTLVKTIFANRPNTIWLNGDDEQTSQIFSNFSAEKARLIIGDASTLIIDEAQRIENIGLKLKIIQDNFGDRIQIVATGSSSFDLANKINEPMTGRKWVFKLYPFATNELVKAEGIISEISKLDQRLVYGMYPDVVNHPDKAKRIVLGLASDDLYKDILNMGSVIKTDKLQKVLRTLAHKVGSQVSLRELATLVDVDHKTIGRYIALLEQSFIIFRVPSYSRNLRNEIKSSNKYYFYDTGIRNALINDFSLPDVREDIGNLFENFVMSEIKKRTDDSVYFWRTTSQQEVDCVIERDGHVDAIEIKWSEKKHPHLPKTFVDKYSPRTSRILNRSNITEFLTSSSV